MLSLDFWDKRHPFLLEDSISTAEKAHGVFVLVWMEKWNCAIKTDFYILKKFFESLVKNYEAFQIHVQVK